MLFLKNSHVTVLNLNTKDHRHPLNVGGAGPSIHAEQRKIMSGELSLFRVYGCHLLDWTN